jgi:hypothetical protein
MARLLPGCAARRIPILAPREWQARSNRSGHAPFVMTNALAAGRPTFEIHVKDCRALPPSEWPTDICLPLAAK